MTPFATWLLSVSAVFAAMGLAYTAGIILGSNRFRRTEIEKLIAGDAKRPAALSEMCDRLRGQPLDLDQLAADFRALENEIRRGAS